MAKQFHQVQWDAQLEDDCRRLVRLAVLEDLGRGHDWTTVALVSEEALGRAVVVARGRGVAAGLAAARLVVEEYDPRVEWRDLVADGTRVEAGARLAALAGSARSLLAAERPMLNMLGRLSGIATLTRQYVDAIAGTSARIYDTRKTMLGWRRLEKYAVRLGGGTNHRTGLCDAILIKDNHLALGAESEGIRRFSPAEAVRRARAFLAATQEEAHSNMIVEVEVDNLEQFKEVLHAEPDIVLLDNMPHTMLREAVEHRNRTFPQVELEASGGISLDTVADAARSGVERISVGALTHSAVWFDVGLDWVGFDGE